MKTEKRKLDIIIDKVETSPNEYDVNFYHRLYPPLSHKITIEGYISDFYNTDLRKLEIYAEFEVPETIKEFIELHGIDKPKLVDWLNENYKNETN